MQCTFSKYIHTVLTYSSCVTPDLIALFPFCFQAAKNKLAICQQKIKAHKKKEKKTFANMFDKFAEIDKKKEEQEKKRNARPDAMNHIDEWEG